jgi:hypothetical protein
MNPGTPGGRAVGTPYEPPLAPQPPPPAMSPRIETLPSASTMPPFPLTRAMCEDGWTPSTNVPRVEFNRRCARMKPRP